MNGIPFRSFLMKRAMTAQIPASPRMVRPPRIVALQTRKIAKGHFHTKGPYAWSIASEISDNQGRTVYQRAVVWA